MTTASGILRSRQHLKCWGGGSEWKLTEAQQRCFDEKKGRVSNLPEDATEREKEFAKIALFMANYAENLQKALNRVKTERTAALNRVKTERTAALNRVKTERTAALERVKTERTAALNRVKTERTAALERNRYLRSDLSKAWGVMVACYRAIDRRFGNEIRAHLEKNDRTQKEGQMRAIMEQMQRLTK